jgi:hypothetical protein
MPGQRSYAAGHFSLELDGKNVGPLHSASGGDAFADVVATPSKFFAKKTVSGVRYDPFTLELGFAMSQPLYDWMAAALTGAVTAKSGAVVEADAAGTVRARREFSGAVISELGFPAADGASKQPGYLVLKLTPEQVTSKKGSGKVALPAAAKQKLWTSSSFRFELGGLDTTKVAKVEAFTVKTNVASPVEELRRARTRATPLDFPNLRVSLAAASAQSWSDWFDDFVIAGNATDKHEKSGTLRFLAADLKQELGQVRFLNVGIFKLAGEPAAATAVKRMAADLYCERLELSIPPP